MKPCRSRPWTATLFILILLVLSVLGELLVGGTVVGCSGRKQVPFGLQDAGETSSNARNAPGDVASELLVGTALGAGQVEVPVAGSTLVLENGYGLASLQIDLDGSEPVDTLVVSAGPQDVIVQAAYARGLDVATRRIDSFLVPSDCTDPTAEIRQLSSSLIGIRIEHKCEAGARTNFWVLTIEAQPRVRERITILPPNDRSTAPIELALSGEDRDADGYEDVVANVRIGDAGIPLTWLNRPGGFSRDVSQPETTFREISAEAREALESDPEGAEKRARSVVDAFVALCRESGAARIGLSGTEGLQCQHSPATAGAVAVAIEAAIRRGRFVRALELRRWWDGPALQPSAEDRERVRAAWRGAKPRTTVTWRPIDREGSPASLYFLDDDTLLIDGRTPRSVQLSSGSTMRVSAAEITPPVRDPSGRYAVRAVRATCLGFEAEIAPIHGKQTHRVPIDRRSDQVPCKSPIDRPASPFEWAALGWAPQGLVAAQGDRLRVVPLNAFAKPAGRPIDLKVGTPLPAPIRGARITPDGSRYVIPHHEGIVVRDWRGHGAGLWIRPPDWDAVPGPLRSIALSPNGRQVALQKGTEIRLLSW